MPSAFERLAEGAVLGKLAPDQGPRGRDAEQDIFADRRLMVVALGIERLDELGHARGGEPLAQEVSRLDQPAGELRMLLGVDHAGQAEAIDVLLEADLFEEIDEDAIELVQPRRPPACSRSRAP